VPREHAYRANVVWTGAAHGSTKTYAAYSRDYTIFFDGKPVLAGSADPAFRGTASRYNPEELLLASLAACHMLAYLALCAREGIAVVAYRDEASGTMSEAAGAGRFTFVRLAPQVTVDDARLERALELHDVAREECFIANSVNFPVEHVPRIERA
jgi:organic hydroperoxide reductase OsmC/OhrA